MILLPCLLSVLSVVQAEAKDVVVADLSAANVKHTADFVKATDCPFALDGDYLRATSQGADAKRGEIRVPAPVGAYYVYVAWVRHPKGAKDVLVRAGDIEKKVDQSRLANGMSPDDVVHDDMGGYQGLCTSGLFRLTDRPLTFREGDTVEIERSDTEPDTVTTLDCVVFSPNLYLDDVGNDAKFSGKVRVCLNARSSGKGSEPGCGVAFLPVLPAESSIEWTLPREGLFLLSVNPNRGGNRAETAAVEIQLSDGTWATRSMVNHDKKYGRLGWQDLGVLSASRGTKIKIGAAKDGLVSPDLLRLTAIDKSALVEHGKGPCQQFTVQWEDPTPLRPWLREVRFVAPDGTPLKTEPLANNSGLPHGARVHAFYPTVPLLGSKEGLEMPLVGGNTIFRVELADDYGFTLSANLLRRERFVWLKDLGIFACGDGDFAAERSKIEARAAKVEAARKLPFQSTSEKYFKLTGVNEATPGHDSRAFEFAYEVPRPLAPRSIDSFTSIPEVNYQYFCERYPDLRHRRMFLGWPNGVQEFYVLSNGAIGTSSKAGYRSGFPPAEDFRVDFGAGDPPVFREHGDLSVTQSIEDGYHIIVHTKWRERQTDVHMTELAYPLAGEEVRTGNEPLGGFVRLRRAAGGGPLWLRIRPEVWEGLPAALPHLGKARLENGRLLAGERIVLAVDHAKIAVESPSDKQVLVKIEPERDHADLVIPYVAVKEPLVAGALTLGFEGALARTKRYWDAHLARGASISVADPIVVNKYKTLYPRNQVTGDLDVEGNYVMKTSPIHYDTVWLHNTAFGIEGLSRRGHFEEARQYLDAVFKWQGSQGGEVEAGAYGTWKGFFNAPPRYPVPLWLNYHGWTQWAAARYFLFSDDRAWLDQKLPALIESLEWTRSQRRRSMKDDPDGSRPINYGWLPPGRVTDGSWGNSPFTDGVNWMGFCEVVNVLERIGHPRTAEFRREADDYHHWIVRGLRLASRNREPVRLNDGTFVPYVPGYLQSSDREVNMWFAAVTDGGLEGILDTGILQGDPMQDWVLRNLEDNLFVMTPNLADQGHILGHTFAYLRCDQPEPAIYSFYSNLATQMARQTLTTIEHRSWGINRIYDLSPWPLCYYTRLLAGMLCDDEGGRLFYGQATPRAWLDPGKEIRVERLQTYFGPTSFTLTATEDRITGTIDLPTRYKPSAIRLRLRVNGRIEWVKLNGQAVPSDPATETVTLSPGGQRIDVEAAVVRPK